MRAKIFIALKSGVHDPQGSAVMGALKHLGFKNVSEVRVGKYVELSLDDIAKENAKFQVKEMCERLLANPVIESYSFEILP